MFTRICKDIFTSPYRLLPLAVFVFAVLCWIAHPNGAVRTGMLADTDDYMRLNETINWLSGAGGWQGWHDLSHPRLSPGTDTIVHWSRLLDLPLALVMLPLITSIGMANAALVASFIIPPATFALLLWLSIALARIFVGADRANLAAPLTLFAPLTLLNFVPGRVDHHGYEILVAAFGLLCLERMQSDEAKGHRYALFAALAFACGLWIGTEALPWVVMFVASLALIAAWQGGMLLRRAALFGISFAAANLLILPLAVAPGDYGNMALSWYSTADVALAGLVAGMFLFVFIIDKICSKTDLSPSRLREGLGVGGELAAPRDVSILLPAHTSGPPPTPPASGRGAPTACTQRLFLMCVCAVIAAAIFCKLVPNLQNGPFADYDDFDSTIALASIGEAQPLIHNFQINLHNHLQIVASFLSALQLLFLPCAGLIALGAAAKNAPHRRGQFFAHGVFLAVAIGGTLFWQMRIGWFMQFFAVAPLTYLLVLLWQKIADHHQGRQKFILEIAAFAMLGFVPVIVIPSLAHDAPIMSDVVLFPAARPPVVCPLRTATDFLNQVWVFGDHPRTILSGANEGPELLYRTRHNVIGANFNVAGNEDVYNFFGARDDAEAKTIAKRWSADLVLVCRSFPLSYARIDHAHLGKTAFLSPTSDGKLHLVSNPNHLTLIERLVRGPVPPWLRPVEIPGDENYLLFEIQK